MKKEIKHWITGTFPPPPQHIRAEITHEMNDGEVIRQTIVLHFSIETYQTPSSQHAGEATLTLELMIPPGDGPFPVFMTQWNHRHWAAVAVRRGYIGCIYAGADLKDDTEAYANICYPQYDFTRLMRRAWGASRVVDYLFTLPVVDKEKIGITGHSRNGKQSLMAAAFDERFTAVISSSGGTGAEDPFRYTSDKYNNETILDISDSFPNWMHPRLRFFIGREHKLPVDQNSMMALVAPRGLMLSSAITEGAGNPWGIEQAFLASQHVYRFLDAEENLAIRLRHGRHGTAARDIEAYVDFFDYVFGRTFRKPENYLYYNYTFDSWKKKSGERIDLNTYEPKKMTDFLAGIKNVNDWQNKKSLLQQHIKWTLGDEPPGVTNPGPKVLANARKLDDYLRDVILRPGKTNVGRIVVGPYHTFGDYLYGNLYFPIDEHKQPLPGKKPVIIFLHEYDYSTGYARGILPFLEQLVAKGFVVFTYDMIGFGTRIQEGTFFYERYPHWSKMGKMVTDARGAVDALENMDIIDPNHIYIMGYALGGTVGLYAAAFDERVAGVATLCGFNPTQNRNSG